MKIVCSADIHIGYKNYTKIDQESGLSYREIQTINLFNEMVDYIINNNIDMFIFAGDMYKNNQPSPSIVDEVNKIFKRLSDANIKTLILDGNHDVSKLVSANSGLKQFSTLNIPNIIHTRFKHIEIINNIRFLFLPTYHTKEEIKEIIDELDNNYPTIIIGHLSLTGAKLNDWNIMEKETSIPIHYFDKECIKAVVLGHFHKHQILNDSPLIFYTSSLNRIDFTEEKQDKGFVELDFDGINIPKLTFHKVNAQKFCTINVKCENNVTETILKEINKYDIKNSVVRIIADVPTSEQIDDKTIINKLTELQAQYILKIQRTDSRISDIKINNTFLATDVYAAIDKYLENDKRKVPRTIMAKDIIQTVEQRNN